MDLGDPRTMSLLLEIYGTLPRAGPGSTADTLRALSLVPTKTISAVLDLGCGPGAQTLVLAEALHEASILAIDLTPQMVTEAARRVAECRFGDRVLVDLGDMMEPMVAPGSQDLIWCEGAIYVAGVARALTAWRPLLARDGSVAFTEPVWLNPSPAEEPVKWWRDEYPAITDQAGVRASIEAAGFDTVGSFVLAADSWWNDYYGPMEARIAAFRSRHFNDPVADEIAIEADREIDMFRRYSADYSYGFFVVRPRTGPPAVRIGASK